MTGVDGDPSPSSLIFHLIFFDSLQLAGGVASTDMPIIDGPRQVGQLSAAKVGEVNAEVTKTAIITAWHNINFFIDIPFQLSLLA